jgi:hypothetical protein
MLPFTMIRRRSTPRHFFYSQFTALDSRSSSAYRQEHPFIPSVVGEGQPQSPHAFTSQLSVYPGVGGLPPFSSISVRGACSGLIGALKSTRALPSTDPCDASRYPPVYPACPVYPALRKESRRGPLPPSLSPFPDLCGLCVSVFSSLSLPFDFKLWTACPVYPEPRRELRRTQTRPRANGATLAFIPRIARNQSPNERNAPATATTKNQLNRTYS